MSSDQFSYAMDKDPDYKFKTYKEIEYNKWLKTKSLCPSVIKTTEETDFCLISKELCDINKCFGRLWSSYEI